MTNTVLLHSRPESSKFVDELLGVELKPFNFKTMEYDNDTLIISRTGYTGSDGFEVYGQPEAVKSCFASLFIWGNTLRAGARDTLRFEAGLPLYGNELGPDITPVEAGLHRFIDLNKPFNGRDVLQAQKDRATEGSS